MMFLSCLPPLPSGKLQIIPNFLAHLDHVKLQIDNYDRLALYMRCATSVANTSQHNSAVC